MLTRTAFRCRVVDHDQHERTVATYRPALAALSAFVAADGETDGRLAAEHFRGPAPLVTVEWTDDGVSFAHVYRVHIGGADPYCVVRVDCPAHGVAL